MRAEAVDDVIDALRHADLVHHLAEQRRGQRRFLRRLDDDRVAAGERRADLPRHQQQRQVPRRNHRDHALGPAQAVIDGALAVRRVEDEGLGRDVLHRFGEHLEIGGAARNVDMRGEAVGLAGVEAFGGEEFVEAGVDLVGDRGEQIGALRHRHRAPGAVERRTRRAHRRVDLGLAAFRHAADQAVVERRAVFPALARGSLRERAVDEMGGVAPRRIHPSARMLMQSLNRHASLP